MPQVRTGVVAMTFGVCVLVLAGASRGGSLGAQGGAQNGRKDGLGLALHLRREAASDLEIRGLEKDGPRFVSRNALLVLPQVEALVKRDENFIEMPVAGVRVGGVQFDVLLKALGVGEAAKAEEVAVEAVSVDGYNPTYPPDYMLQHHPILILTMDGISPSAWADKTHTSNLGPYFVAYADFKPAFYVLSHEDRPQVPAQILRLEIATERQMFAGILPRWTTDSSVSQGYRIAQQNCFRCHGAAGYGGTKSKHDWRYLSEMAKKTPKRFAKWVHDPQSIDAKSEMPPNPKYDRDTLTALTRYFAVFSERPSGRASTRGD